MSMAEEEIPMGQVTPEEKDDGVVEEPSTPVKQRPASKAKTPKSKSPKAKSPKGKKPKAKGKSKPKPKPKAGSCCQWRNRTAKEEASSSWLGSRVAGGSGGGSTRS